MVDFTLLELHFEDSDLTANAPYSRGQTDDAPSETTASGPSGKGALFALLVGLGFSIAVTYLVRKKVGSRGDDASEADSEIGSEVDLEA